MRDFEHITGASNIFATKDPLLEGSGEEAEVVKDLRLVQKHGITEFDESADVPNSIRPDSEVGPVRLRRVHCNPGRFRRP